MTRRNNKKIFKSFKDYLVPIVIVFVLLILIINHIFPTETEVSNTGENTPSLDLTLSSSQTEAYIEYVGLKKSQIEGDTKLYKTEKLEVATESVSLSNDTVSMNLNKLGKLEFNEDESFTLYSSDLWCETQNGIVVEMRYAKVNGSEGSVFSLSQNEVASTINVLYGNIEVQNLAGKSTVLQKGEKLVIMRNNASDANSDLSLLKEEIDDYTKNDDWFLKNNGASYLAKEESSDSGTGITKNSSGSAIYTNSSYISFKDIYDEMDVKAQEIDINGNILLENVYSMTINGKTTNVDLGNKTFLLKGLKLESKINDVVYKVYDENSNLLDKGVITIYFSNGTGVSTTTATNAGVENYPITSSPFYQIISPKLNPYTTTENVVRIEGTVPTRTVKRIVINDFQLTKFPEYGTYWYYYANSEFGNLKPGVNIYNIKYYGEEDKLVYETNFTIIKNEIKEEEIIGETALEESIIEEYTGSVAE